MIKLVYCIRRHPSMSRGEFQQYWKTHHAELVKSHADALGAVRYVQSHTLDSDLATGANEARASVIEPFDGITEFWWPDAEAISQEGVSEEQMMDIQRQLLEDEGRFIDVQQSVMFMTDEHPVYER